MTKSRVDRAEAASAGAPEIQVTPAMIKAGSMAYYASSGEGWSNPGECDLSEMLRDVFSAMLIARQPEELATNHSG